ncbi:hypothetical protein J1614_005854 [Plenodomus biglobosus]|nr:hypothetical protein J1614_005854 [Plenodomus biglobosus]
MDARSTQAQKAVKLSQAAVNQLHNIRKMKLKSYAVKQWYDGISSSVKKPLGSLRSKLHLIVPSNDSGKGKTEPTRPSPQVDNNHVNSNMEAPSPVVPKITSPPNPNLQSNTCRTQLPRHQRYAKWQPMSGAYPTIMPPRPQHMPPRFPQYAYAPNKYGSVRLRSSVQPYAPPQRHPRAPLHNPVRSPQYYYRHHHQYMQSPARQTRGPSRLAARDHVMFTQAELDLAFERNPPALSLDPSTLTLVPELGSSSGSRGGGGGAGDNSLDALVKEGNVAAGEWGCAAETEGEDGSGTGDGDTVYHDAEESFGEGEQEAESLLDCGGIEEV